MGENSAIEWTDHTFNPWIGCTKVAAGCAHCYAETLMDSRYGKAQWGPNGTRVLTSPSNWSKPLKWNRDAERAGVRARVFCASLADVFEDRDGPIHDHNGDVLKHPEGSHSAVYGKEAKTLDDVRQDLFRLIDATPWLDWLLLTKRPENIREMWPRAWSGPSCIPNVWVGTSVATQEDADRNVPHLLECHDRSPVLFLSMEPLLGPVDLRGAAIDWVIVGGESGPNARPMHPDWARSIRDQCQAAGVPFLFKQWGEHLPFDQASTKEQRDAFTAATKRGEQSYFGARVVGGPQGLMTGTTAGVRPVSYAKIGKGVAGRLLDGRTWGEFPAVAAGVGT